MLSAIAGDVVGSRHENTGNQNPEVALLAETSRFTDDTVCSLAIGQWLLEDGGRRDPGPWLRSLSLDHIERGFAANYLNWVRHADAPEQPSCDNGAAMRASAVAYWAQDDAEAEALAVLSTRPTHAHTFSAEGTRATVWAIRHAFAHRDPERLLADASRLWSYGDLTLRDPAAERPTHVFDTTVRGTVPLALALAARGGSFEGALRLAVSMGGDADTLAAVTAPIAEGLYGLELDLVEAALRRPDFWFDIRLWDVLCGFYAHPRVVAFHQRHDRMLPPLQQWRDRGPFF